MPSIDVTFEVVTPAYAGGADRSKTDGLRPPTLKSLLRFWWRAMHPELQGAKLFDEEARIFGAPRYSNGDPCGQGIRVVPTASNFTTETHVYSWREQVPLFYMAYGADKHKDHPQGPDIPHERVRTGGWFKFRIYSSPAMSPSDWAEVKQAIVLLSCFGGFGGRSRRGFGSLQISSPNEGSGTGQADAGGPSFPDFAQCHDRQAVVQALRSVLAGLPTATGWVGTPEHTAISSGLRVVAGDLKDTWDGALIESGTVFNDLRRLYGAKLHGPNKVRWGPDFSVVNGWRGAPPAVGTAPPLGSAFGLPHNYQFRSGTNRKPSIEAFGTSAGVPDPEKQRRRASDVLFKVLAVGGNPRRYCPVVSWLPSLFLPADIVPTFKRGGSLVRLATPATSAITELFGGTTTVAVTTPTGAVAPAFQGYAARPDWQVVWP